MSWRDQSRQPLPQRRLDDADRAAAGKVVAPGWFDPLDAQNDRHLGADYAKILGDHRRALLLWDAHGFEIAEVVLGEILPRLIGREHLVLMHDIADNRYAHVDRSYNGQPLWKGSEWQERTGCLGASMNVGWMHSIQDQIIAIADFRHATISSSDRRITSSTDCSAARPLMPRRCAPRLGDEFFSTQGHWAFFSLNGKTGAVRVSRRDRTSDVRASKAPSWSKEFPACRLPSPQTPSPGRSPRRGGGGLRTIRLVAPMPGFGSGCR